MSDDSDFEREIKETFLTEVKELMEDAESSLILLERDPTNLEARESIFRLLHNMKGSSQAVGFEDLSRFVHHIENLFVKIKKDEIPSTPRVIDLLLRCNDSLKNSIFELQKDLNTRFDYHELIQEIEFILNSKAPIVESAPLASVVPEVPPQATFEEISALIAEEAAAAALNTVPLDSIVISNLAVAPTENELPSAKTAEVQTPSGAGPAAKQEEFIRLPLSRVENLINYLGEQVLLQSILEHARHDFDSNEMLIHKTINQLSKITYDIQQTAISLRMVSIKSLFTKMERITRDTAQGLGKKVVFSTIGADSEIDKTIADALGDPLTHMIRNAIDHGIESVEQRIKNGKNEAGSILLSAVRRGSFFYIEIQDDGDGLDRDLILEKSLNQGLVERHAVPLMSEREIFELIFKNGFSTKDVATELSGRGVGMDVVKNTITKLKGTCEIRSEKGKGTKFIIRLPITLAIFNGAVVRLGAEKFVFPNSDISEIVTVDTSHFQAINKNESVIQIKDEVMPILDARAILKVKKSESDEPEKTKKIVLISRLDQKAYAILVDEIISQQRVVLKNLGEETAGSPGIAGGTILGDGKVALIVELPELISHHMGFVA
jgi:two-component system chemotaxis sensor kinase CheA